VRTVHFSTCVAMGVILLGVQSGTAEEIFSDINRFPGERIQLNSHHDIDMASVSAFASLEKELMTVNSELADVRARLALVEGGEVVQAGYNSSASGRAGSRCCRDCWCNPCDGVASSGRAKHPPRQTLPRSSSSSRPPRWRCFFWCGSIVLARFHVALGSSQFAFAPELRESQWRRPLDH